MLPLISRNSWVQLSELGRKNQVKVREREQTFSPGRMMNSHWDPGTLSPGDSSVNSRVVWSSRQGEGLLVVGGVVVGVVVTTGGGCGGGETRWLLGGKCW